MALPHQFVNRDRCRAKLFQHQRKSAVLADRPFVPALGWVMLAVVVTR